MEECDAIMATLTQAISMYDTLVAERADLQQQLLYNGYAIAGVQAQIATLQQQLAQCLENQNQTPP